MSDKPKKLSMVIINEVLDKYKIDIEQNQHIGQSGERVALQVLEEVSKRLEETIVVKVKKKQIDEPEMMSVPMFENTSDEINVMSRLEFVMTHATGSEELDYESQSRIASWFVSKFGDKFY
jgi:hypothetical protein